MARASEHTSSWDNRPSFMRKRLPNVFSKLTERAVSHTVCCFLHYTQSIRDYIDIAICVADII